MTDDTNVVRPVCPKCMRKSVRARATKEKKFLCLLCGYEGTDAEFVKPAGTPAPTGQ